MRLDKFTNKFQIAISDAQSLALGRDNQFIEPVHMLHALLNQQGGTVRPLFDQLECKSVKISDRHRSRQSAKGARRRSRCSTWQGNRQVIELMR